MSLEIVPPKSNKENSGEDPPELRIAKDMLHEAGKQQSENGIRLGDGTIIGTQEDDEKLKKALEQVIQAAIKSGRFRIIEFGKNTPQE